MIKSSLVAFTMLLLSVSASPVNTSSTLVDTTDLVKVRDYNEKTLKKIDDAFQKMEVQ